MKAVIVEIKENFASVLSDDGCVIKIKNNKYEIGQVIQLQSLKMNLTKKLSMVTAAAAAVLVLSVGSWAYASPYSYVSLDVNPSIEYILNRFDRVLRVKAVNYDGEAILNEIDLDELKNKKIEAALTKTVEQIHETGYFNGQEEGGIVIATSAKNLEKAEELAQDLQSAVKDEIIQSGDNVVVETFSVGKERVTKAQELGVTPGKLNLVEKLQESADHPENIVLEEWLDKPVKEIMKATKELNKLKDDASAEADTDTTSKNDTNESNSQNKDNTSEDKADKAGGKAAKTEDKADRNTDKAQNKADKDADKTQNKADKDAGKAQDKSNKDADQGQDKSDKHSDKNQDKADKDSTSGKSVPQADKYTKQTDKPKGASSPDRNNKLKQTESTDKGIPSPDDNGDNSPSKKGYYDNKSEDSENSIQNGNINRNNSGGKSGN